MDQGSSLRYVECGRWRRHPHDPTARRVGLRPTTYRPDRSVEEGRGARRVKVTDGVFVVKVVGRRRHRGDGKPTHSSPSFSRGTRNETKKPKRTFTPLRTSRV